MIYTEHKFTLDVNKTASQVSLSVKKGDTARRLMINLMASGYPYHITEECYAVIAATKPDGHVIFNNCTIENCVIRYDFTPQTVAAVGLVECEVIVYGKRGLQISSAGFSIIVEESNYAAVESSSEATAFAALIMEVQALVARGVMAPAIVSEAAGEQISLTDASNELVCGLRIFGKSTQDGTPTVDAPVEIVNVGAGGSIEAKLLGKNIVSDLTYLNSNADYASLVKSDDTSALRQGETYTASVTLTAAEETEAYWNNVSGFFELEAITVSAGTKRYSRTFVALADGDAGTSKIFMSKTSTGDGVAIQPSDFQIERGAVATDYEVTEQSMVISTPEGLLGVPMSRDGIYKDSEEKHWNSDEIDLKRGVYVKRIGTVTSADMLRGLVALNSESDNYIQFTINNVLGSIIPAAIESSSTTAHYKALCSHLPLGGQVSTGTSNDSFWIYKQNTIVLVLNKTDFPDVESVETWLTDNDVKIQYILQEPIETELTAAEIAAFAALHTYKPNTSIYNDAGAYMAAEYVADTKRYIDNATSPAAVIAEVTLLASAWEGSDSLYSQVVEIDGITENSQVNLTPSVEQLSIFYEKDLTFVTENDGGVVTVYAIGQKPQNDYTIQADIVEVIA